MVAPPGEPTPAAGGGGVPAGVLSFTSGFLEAGETYCCAFIFREKNPTKQPETQTKTPNQTNPFRKLVEKDPRVYFGLLVCSETQSVAGMKNSRCCEMAFIYFFFSLGEKKKIAQSCVDLLCF